MRIDQVSLSVYQVTLHAYELAALVAAARWVASEAQGELAPEALAHVKQVLARYDEAAQRVAPALPLDREGPA